MSAAFKTQVRPAAKLVLLALCDSANDQGECYPSVLTLMEKCSSGERTVQEALTLLERDGFIRREFRRGRSTVYSITDPRNWRPPSLSAPPQTAHPTPAPAAPPPPRQPHPTPAPAAPITITEPSVEPSLNQKAPRKRDSSQPAMPADVDPQTWADWLALRRAKKAPVTATVLRHAHGEAAKAGLTLDAFLQIWCGRGSQGLEAAWVRPDERAMGNMTALDRKAAEAAKWMHPKSPMLDYIDMEQTNAPPIAIR